jgi:hypothetical protein
MIVLFAWLPICIEPSDGAIVGENDEDGVPVVIGSKVELDESVELNVPVDSSDGEDVVMYCDGCSVGAEVGDEEGGSKEIIVSVSTFTPHVVIPLGIPGFG